MSDTQTSITDRFPKKASRTSSILSKDVPPDKKPKSDKPTSPSSQEFDPTDSLVQSQRRGSRELAEGKTEACGLVQRCVIIQKDENGFGLTVSGDNPVFVQLVKDDGAAMRAGVQTGDRIIKVNGTLVTHSNHVEVVKLIKSGSYVALTVLGRPPGLPQIPLPEVDGDLGLGRPGDRTSFSSPHSPGQQLSLDRPGTQLSLDRPGTERPFSPMDLITSPLPAWEEENSSVHHQKVDILQKMLFKEQQDLQAMKEEYSRKPSPRLLKDIQGANKHIPQLQGQLCKATGVAQDGDGEDGGGVTDPDRTASSRGDTSADGSWSSNNMSPVPRGFGPVSPESLYHRDSSFPSPRSTPRDSLASCQSPDAEDSTDQDCLSPSAAGTPSSSSSGRLASQIIGAEDDYFDSDQEQPNGQAGGFQSVELLKSRPAHLGAFLHHVISQFDPAPLLCYLHADLYKQTNSKESRRVFLDFHSFFIDRGANLKVAVPESMASDLDRRRTELIPEETTRQYVQTLQDSLLPDIQRHLEDFRQKRCMGLTLAEVELVRLDSDRGRDRLALDRERSCAESIITKIEELLLATQPTEEERCTTMQYVILTYMKHLGVRVKEPRGLEPKRVRINFLPKIKKSMKAEKEGGEEKVKRTRFPSILGPQRRPSRIESAAAGKAVDGARPRPQKQLSQPILGASDQPEAGRLRGSQSSEGSELTYPASLTAHSPCSSVYGSEGSRDTEAGGTPTSALSRLSDGLQSAELDSLQYPANMHFDYSPSPYSLDQLQEEDRESDRVLEGGTPKALRRLEGVVLGEVQSEDDQGTDSEHDPLNWQQLVGREVLAGLRAHEIKRQEVINELFYTERAHVRMLRVLDSVFYQRLTRDSILPPADVKNIFTNLDEIVQLHVSISDQMAALRKRNESSVIIEIGDDLLSWFSEGEEEKIKQAVGTFCSNQPFSLEIIKSRQKKDSRFNSFLQEAESNRLCRRLQLKDIIPVEMQRLTKYPLLLENIAKCTDSVEEKDKVKRAADCCRRILHHVNQAVRESENKQRLEDYQRRLDLSSLKQTENPMIMELKNLDLTKKKMVHEGPLSWKVNRDKTIELYTLLLEDILVLLQRQDERLILKCHSKNLPGASDTKHTFSPVIRLNAVLVRSVATDNKSFFVLSMSDSGAQIYELMAPTVADQRTWQCLITQRADAIKEVKPHSVIPSLPSLPQTDERDGVEIITAGVSRLSKELPDRTSTGSSRSTDKESTSASSTMTSSSSSTIVQGSLPGAETEEEEEEEEEGFVDPELPDRLSYQMPELPDRLSYQAPAADGAEADSVGYSASRADEALKTLSALKRVLVTQLMSQEASERAQRSSGARLLRTTSLRTPVDSRARLPVHNGTEKDQAQKDQGQKDQSQNQPDDPGQDPGSGDTGFFDTPEDYAGYLVLEEFGGSGESTTDDDLPGKQLGAARGCAGDSGISLRFSSASQGGSLSSFSRQVLSHLRNLQTSLNQLKEVEAKYYTLVRSRPERPSTDTDQNRDKR